MSRSSHLDHTGSRSSLSTLFLAFAPRPLVRPQPPNSAELQRNTARRCSYANLTLFLPLLVSFILFFLLFLIFSLTVCFSSFFFLFHYTPFSPPFTVFQTALKRQLSEIFPPWRKLLLSMKTEVISHQQLVVLLPALTKNHKIFFYVDYKLIDKQK